MKSSKSRLVTSRLLGWYKKNRIHHPWRETRDPYAVWLSEILLQQTRIPVALRYYEEILQRFPSVHDLSHAKEAEFLSLWSGAGYYARAGNMLRTARQIVSKHNGVFPADAGVLVALPGIGRYTAGALCNICFDRLTPALDANATRVLARLTDNRKSIHSSQFRKEIEQQFMTLGSGSPAGIFFQALMELGEHICLPKPNCLDCPVRQHCLAFRRNTTQKIPDKKKKKAAQEFYWYFLLLNNRNRYYYALNPTRAFLKNAWIFPDVLSTTSLSIDQIRTRFEESWPIRLRKIAEFAVLRHSVTYRKITASVFSADDFTIENKTGKWLTPAQIRRLPTSSITAKILHAGKVR